MSDPKTVESRRRVLRLLDELRYAGLIGYSLTPPDITGPEPHIEIFARRRNLTRQAPDGVSEAARGIWDALRDGRCQFAVTFLDALKGGEAQ